MIFGTVTVDGEAVTTHRDSYVLAHLTVVSVRRPLLGIVLPIGAGFVGFAAAFGDLLYADEIGFFLGAAALALIAGLWLGQLKLLSRDLRGSELSGAVWGSHRSLQTVRNRIVRALRDHRGRLAMEAR